MTSTKITSASTTTNYTANGNGTPPIRCSTSLGEMAYHSLCVHADKIGHISYDTGVGKLNGQILDEAIKSANLLRHHFKLNTGDTIGVFVEPDDPLVSITFGAIFNGNPLHFIDPRFHLDEIHQLFQETQPKLVLCGYSCEAGIALKSSLDKTTTAVLYVEDFRHLWHDFSTLPSDHQQLTIQDVNFSRHDTIAIISMSGRVDKFERLTHDNMIIHKDMQMFEGKTFLSFKSWNVYAEISNLLATTIMGGTRIVTRDRFNCKLTQEIVEEYGVHLLQLTAYQVQQMRPAHVTGHYFETVERILCTGPRINDALVKFAAVCFPHSTLTPHLLHHNTTSAPNTPTSPVSNGINRMEFKCGTEVPKTKDKRRPKFLKGLFKKKTQATEI